MTKSFWQNNLRPQHRVRLASQPHTVHVRSPKNTRSQEPPTMSYYTARFYCRWDGGAGGIYLTSNNSQHMYAKKSECLKSGKFPTRSTEPKLVWGAAKYSARLSF